MGVADRFPTIGSYGFLSDCHTAALVSYDGAVEWLCLPRFDSPSAFAALLDRGAGHFRLKPRGVVVPIGRRYEPGTLVIETTWVTDTGWVEVHDALTIAEWATSDGKGSRPDTKHESDHSLLRTSWRWSACPASATASRAPAGPAASWARRSPSPPTAPSCG
jgi:GH15 family glucan-1,4-alpha-glucosidase